MQLHGSKKMLSPVYQTATVIVVAIGVCLAQEELVAVVRSGYGDLTRFTTQDGVVRNDRCPLTAPTYLVGGRSCVADTVLQRSK